MANMNITSSLFIDKVVAFYMYMYLRAMEANHDAIVKILQNFQVRALNRCCVNQCFFPTNIGKLQWNGFANNAMSNNPR